MTFVWLCLIVLQNRGCAKDVKGGGVVWEVMHVGL